MSVYILTLATLIAAGQASSEPQLPTSLGLETIRALPLQHDGRWPPLDTVARDIVETTTGTPHFQGHDPVLWLLAWTFSPETWKEAPLIGIPQAELRKELGLSSSKTVFSYAELLGHRRLAELTRGLSQIESGRKMNPLEAKVSDINEKLTLLQRVFQGRLRIRFQQGHRKARYELRGSHRPRVVYPALALRASLGRSRHRFRPSAAGGRIRLTARFAPALGSASPS